VDRASLPDLKPSARVSLESADMRKNPVRVCFFLESPIERTRIAAKIQPPNKGDLQ
jgi:hypothetical protein